MIQEFINKQFYNLFIFTFIFGLVLYGTIGFDSIDEICACILLILFIFATFKTPDWAINKSFLAVSSVFIFYTIYSFYIHSNSAKGIISDMIIQFKPYLAFFAVYYLCPVFSSKQKDLIKKIILIISFFMFLIGCASLVYPLAFRVTVGHVAYFAAIITASSLLYYYCSEGAKIDKMIFILILAIGLFSARSKFYGFFIISLVYPLAFRVTVGHVAYFAAIITASSLLYYYCSEGAKIDKMIFILILAIGLFSARSKFYGFFIISLVTVIFFGNISRLKLNFKTIAIAVLSLAAMVLASWKKMVMYFGVGKSLDSVPEEFMARAMLYVTSFEIFKDFFPFGSGFASFASHSSGVYYSPLYAKYGIENVKGISKNNYSYIADTYYPCLAQFGIIGVFLYILFFAYIIRKAYKLFLSTQKEKYFIIPFLIIGYLLIENIADATFTGHRGFFIMMLLGLVMSEQKHQLLANKSTSQKQPE